MPSLLQSMRDGIGHRHLLGAMLVTSMVAGRVTTNTGRYKVFPVAGSADRKSVV